MPPKRDETALQEEEELQLAIALSQSEAEEKERMVSKASTSTSIVYTLHCHKYNPYVLSHFISTRGRLWPSYQRGCLGLDKRIS